MTCDDLGQPREPPPDSRSRAAPPMPASTSSKTNVGTGSAPAITTSIASMTRLSSPPDAPSRDRARLGAGVRREQDRDVVAPGVRISVAGRDGDDEPGIRHRQGVQLFGRRRRPRRAAACGARRGEGGGRVVERRMPRHPARSVSRSMRSASSSSSARRARPGLEQARSPRRGVAVRADETAPAPRGAPRTAASSSGSGLVEVGEVRRQRAAPRGRRPGSRGRRPARRDLPSTGSWCALERAAGFGQQRHRRRAPRPRPTAASWAARRGAQLLGVREPLGTRRRARRPRRAAVRPARSRPSCRAQLLRLGGRGRRVIGRSVAQLALDRAPALERRRDDAARAGCDRLAAEPVEARRAGQPPSAAAAGRTGRAPPRARRRGRRAHRPGARVRRRWPGRGPRSRSERPTNSSARAVAEGSTSPPASRTRVGDRPVLGHDPHAVDRWPARRRRARRPSRRAGRAAGRDR